ncbi:DUF4383 domain-containing protein [Actinobacteria bacterium YIM 96077]|uniref:DUF4383 domain-containing protein n=1 Tax=Phytoactinopolyspora halophila TaxID=1981511 RepID=A0A329QNW2_9ACTN|nr:DUF4383 domain-containing protein [Phytoactinopolyspora halophila]AYY14557.1 DUF4383 domain-containing protein [Actinobacteria bacterium YIM 96077]RAW14067.1 DUF4383 domain-containing protein [Phytoactinopolyspora halophila]
MTPAPEQPDGPAAVSGPVRQATYVVATAFLVIGVLGFVPGVTAEYDEMRFAGPDSNAQLFELFTVSILHNVVHLVFGVVGIVMARGARPARIYLIVGGLIYLLLFIYGMLVERGSDADIVPLDEASNWLHLGLAIAMVLLGLLPSTRRGGHRAAG